MFTSSRWIFPLLIFMALAAIPTVTAGDINITPVDVGCDYIRWNWTPGLDVTDIFIDGTAICGYETTLNTTLVTGFSPGEIHTIDIVAPSGSGTNITNTSPLSSCAIPSSAGGGSDTSSSYLILGTIGGLVVSVLYIRKRKSEELP